MDDMHLYGDDDMILNRRVVLPEEQHNEVIAKIMDKVYFLSANLFQTA